jgi:N-formylglutamate deformylase
VLWNDPAIGVVRHADAGYERAIECARDAGSMFLSEATVAPYRYRRGASPLVVSMPHAGTFVPRASGALTDCAAAGCDTDWHLPRLVRFRAHAIARPTIVANLSRYVIDVNRPPGRREPLSRARHARSSVPPTPSTSAPLYRRWRPGRGEIARRLDAVWSAVSPRLEREIARVRASTAVAVLWDAHSIVSVAPRLFEGSSPTSTRHGGRRLVRSRARDALEGALDGTAIHARAERPLQGRLHHAPPRPPAEGVHAVQLEMAECIYMQETSPYTFSPGKRRR